MNCLRHIKAFTLAETLVALIVSGILFLGIMEGLTLFRQYSQNKAAQIVSNSRFYDAYYSLADMVSTADSIKKADNATIEIYRQRHKVSLLHTADSMLVASSDLRTDTLFDRIMNIALIGSRYYDVADTLTVTLLNCDTAFLLRFAFDRPKDEYDKDRLSEIERDYRYE